jgi:hypothetical protein
MNINAIGLAGISRAQPYDARAVENSSPGKAHVAAQSLPKAVPQTSVTFSYPLSAETLKHLTFATQKVAPQDEDAHKTPPAQQARAALAANPDLGDQPFGSLVSRIARGLPLVASDSSSQSLQIAPPNSVSAPTNLLADNPALADLVPAALNPVAEGFTNPGAVDQVIG